ncbi:MAG TPA: DEAD/DEAH box helicase [Tenuifilaceae bacterium]|nr:DEAD/DEAH box helicase [Tenuifilaceae bacterium]HPN20411.1 DEAD/DEAH box helicase [Tenuifilaceae bacterium]
MPFDSTITPIFALTIQPHRQLGLMLGAHFIMESDSSDIFQIKENLLAESLAKNETKLADNHKEIIKHLNDITEKALQKHFAKNAKSVVDFLSSLSKDEQLSQYIRSYIERRIAKCIDIAANTDVPIFIRDKNANSLYSERKLNIELEIAQPLFRFERNANEFKYSISASCNGKKIKIEIGNSEVITNEPCIVRIGNKIYRFNGIDGKKLSPFVNKSHITIPKTAEQKYMETFVLSTIRNQLVEAVGFDIVEEKVDGKAFLTLEERLIGGACLTLNYQYNNRTYLANASLANEVYLKLDDGNYTFTKFSRNEAWEKSIVNTLVNQLQLKKVSDAEFIPTEVDVKSTDTLHILVEWINTNSEKLESSGIAIKQAYINRDFYLKTFHLDLSAKSEEDWFDLYGRVKLGDFEIPFIYLKKHIVKGNREFVLPNAQIFVLPEIWFTKFKPLFLMGKESDEKLKVSKSLFNILVDNQIDAPEAKALNTKFSQSQIEGVSIPHNLNATLRDYQVQGYCWLNLLYQNAMNGCLADDMGLGKTLQTLAMLQFASNHPDKNIKTSLIVVPTSLVHNWLKEANRFTPDQNVFVYTGAQRTKSASLLQKYDIVITTYGIIRNDMDFFKDLKFNYVILDESQTIKNPFSKIYRSVLLLKANHYLTLSGTPIENSLSDLWSQLNFLNRGMLGSLKSFRDEYIIPIEKSADTEKERQLKHIIEPLILRRTKEQVAKDLPPLTEQIIYCDMSDAQQEVYEKEKSMIRNSIIESIEQAGVEKSSISILTGLMRLRQIANHPALLDDYATLDSGKFDEVTRSIENIIAEKHKILVFSSFVKHLEQVEVYLKQANIGYEMLTGETANRGKIVEEFQSNPAKQVFLISLKAGGVGLNLTAADYVFILDPWWNPAAEMQATSRAHRIGQQKNVFVYRFISINTVEEKILKLQAKKEHLAQLFIDTNNPLKLADKDVIMELIE